MKDQTCVICVTLLLLASAVQAHRVELDYSETGWRLTHNKNANWDNDKLFLPTAPLLQLPVDCAINRPDQRILRSGPARFGMRLEGEELLARVYQSRRMSLRAAIGDVDCGKEKIVLSPFDIRGALEDLDDTTKVAREILCNYLRLAFRHSNE